jgi:hypothetical protein
MRRKRDRLGRIGYQLKEGIERGLLEEEFGNNIKATIELIRGGENSLYCKGMLILLLGSLLVKSLKDIKEKGFGCWYSKKYLVSLGVVKCNSIGINICNELEFTIVEARRILKERNWVKEYKKVKKQVNGLEL